MGKKEKKVKKLANAGLSILESGKVKLEKDSKISLDMLALPSIENAVISRIDGIISKEEPDIQGQKGKVAIGDFPADELNIVRLSDSVVGQKTEMTVVIVIPKKKALDVFDFMSSSLIGELLRVSTLASCYKKLKPQWVDLNKKDKTSYTNVLYIPKIKVFLNSKNGKFLKSPYDVNLLLLAVGNEKQLGIVSTTTDDGLTTIGEMLPIEDIQKAVINDILETVVRLGIKKFVVNPFSHKVLQKDKILATKLWNEALQSSRCKTNIDSVMMSLRSEEEYLTWNKDKITMDHVSFKNKKK